MSRAVDENGRFRFGTYSEPLTRLNFQDADLSDVGAWWGRPGPGWLGTLVRRMRLKRWHYLCLQKEDLFLAVAVAHVGYVGNVFVYLVDSGRKFEMECLVPLGLGVSVGAASRQRSTYSGIEIDFQDNWLCRLDVKLEGRPLRADFQLKPTVALALLHPLHENRAAYTHKEVGNPGAGWLEWEGRRVDLTESLGGVDYTCSYADRHTKWRWVFLTGYTTDGRRFGLNGAEMLYGEAENYVWLDDRRYPLGHLRFTIPRMGAWGIDGPLARLSFTPQGFRSQNVNYGLVKSRFSQPFGSAVGTIRVGSETVEIAHAFGVCEDHDALW